MTNKEMYIFETLCQWYRRESRPDNFDHFYEIFDWAKRLIEKEAQEKNRPILLERFNAIPRLTKGEIIYITDPNPRGDKGFFIGLLTGMATGVSVMPRHELKKVKDKLQDCAQKTEKLIFFLKHEGFEEMLK